MTDQLPLRAYIDAQIEAVDRELDRRIETQRREREQEVKHLRDLINLNAEQLDRRITTLQRERQQARESFFELKASEQRNIEEQIKGVARELTLVQAAAERAVNKAEASNEKRFEGVNEFRSQLREQATSFASRDYVESRLNAITETVERNSGLINAAVSERRGAGDFRATAITVLLVIVGALAVVSPHIH